MVYLFNANPRHSSKYYPDLLKIIKVMTFKVHPVAIFEKKPMTCIKDQGASRCIFFYYPRDISNGPSYFPINLFPAGVREINNFCDHLLPRQSEIHFYLMLQKHLKFTILGNQIWNWNLLPFAVWVCITAKCSRPKKSGQFLQLSSARKKQISEHLQVVYVCMQIDLAYNSSIIGFCLRRP